MMWRSRTLREWQLFLLTIMWLATAPVVVHAQWRSQFDPVDTGLVQRELFAAVGDDASHREIIATLLDEYVEQVRLLDQGRAELSAWFDARAVPAPGAFRRMNAHFGTDQYIIIQAERRMMTILSDQLFGDLHLVLPTLEAHIRRLEQDARRRRVLNPANFENTPAGRDAIFDAIAWAMREVNEPDRLRTIRTAVEDQLARADALIRSYEHALPDRTTQFALFQFELRSAETLDARERIGDEWHAMNRDMQRDVRLIGNAMAEITEVIRPFLLPEELKRFDADRIRTTRDWIGNNQFEWKLDIVRKQLGEGDAALRSKLEDLEWRYLLAKDAAAVYLREPFERYAYARYWIDARIHPTDPETARIDHEAIQAPYAEASASWTRALDAFHRELEQLAPDQLETSH